MSQLGRMVRAFSRSPIVWGGIASVGFFAYVHGSADAFLLRYTAGHPIEYVEVVFFFVGLAILAVKMLDLLVEGRGLEGSVLGPLPEEPQSVAHARQLLERLGGLPRGASEHALVRRLRDALEFIVRGRSAVGLEDQLKYLADQESARQYGSYGFLRVIIWAIPILGFLGTVVGITMAIANLSPEALEKSLTTVTFGLGVAFDTTALALSLAMVLMFGQYLVERAEIALQARVDARASAELVGRFENLPAGADGQVVAVRRMAETVTATMEDVVRRQIDLWQASIAAAEDRWQRLSETSGQQLQAALSGALVEGLRAHAAATAAAEEQVAAANRQHWEAVTRSAEEHARATLELQKSVAAQAEAWARAVEAAGEVTKLEEALNRNLSTLAGERNFEETVMSLAAAIHLLTARLGASDAAALQRSPAKRVGRAA